MSYANVMVVRRTSGLASVALAAVAVAAVSATGCGKKLGADECNHLLGRGVGLATGGDGVEVVQKQMGIYGGVPLDVDLLRKTARGPVKDAIAEFDAACVGHDDGGATLCGRRAKNMDEFRACGGIVAKAADTGKIARLAVTKKHSVDECSRYAEHAVKIGAGTPDDVSALVKECEDWLEIGFYECRLAAKDAASWNGCDAP